MESSFEESFGGLFSPFGEDDFGGDKTAFLRETDGANDGWDNFPALPSPPFGGLGGDFDMELEFFRTDKINEECKIAGPTLAELNDHRSLSPLINPEMERLHRIATRTEGECSSSCTTARKPQPFIALELTSEKIERPRPIEMKREEVVSKSQYSERFEHPKEPEKKLPSKPTWTMTQDTSSWKNQSEQSASSERMIILPQRKLGLSSSGVCDNQVPKLILTEVKTRLYSAEGTEHPQEAEKSEPESAVAEPNSPVLEDESADEEMDSDDDFDVESHVHGGGLARNRKGRRGDHDDLSPNPRKLLEISRELDRLNKVIGDLKPIHQLPQNARNKSRKEKNKLASRACRLKKKAQHEANKVKLQGLEMEQQHLTDVIDKVKREIILKSSQPTSPRANLSLKVETLVKTTFGNQLVAGHTSDFVHSVLKATARENPSLGSLDELTLCF